MIIIAIDPGQSGGFAVDTGNAVNTFKMPDGMTEQCDLIRELADWLPQAKVWIEKVGMHRAGNNASASVKFARHVGNLETALYMCGFSVEQVAPGVWMKKFGALSKDKTARKNAIKDAVARIYPDIKVTLAVSDALGILHWAQGKA